MQQLFTTTIAIFSCLTVCLAQRSIKPPRNAISLELGKTGLIYNLIFDHKMAGKDFGFRLGAGSNFAKYLNAATFGGGGYYLVGRENRFLELGADLQYLVVNETSDDQKGFSLVYPDHSIRTIYPGMNIGYRSYGKSTLFKVGFSPGLIESKIVAGGYIGYGVTF